MAREIERVIRIEVPDDLDLSEAQVEEILADLRGKLVHTISSATVAVYAKAEDKSQDVEKTETVKEYPKENPKVKTKAG